MKRLWQRFRLWLTAPRVADAPVVDGADRMCRNLASHYVEMGPHAVGNADSPSPGSEQLLARTRARTRNEFERLVPSVSRGIAGSSVGQLAAGGAAEAAGRRAQDLAQAQERIDAHQRSRPQVPWILNRIASHRAFRVAIASLCVAIEMVITSPALAVLSHGKLIFGLMPLEDVLAFLLGLATFMSAEVAAECFVTWLNGRRAQRTRTTRRRRWIPRSRWPRRGSSRPRVRSATGRVERAAGLASLAIVLTMVGLLGWFVSVREHNARAARAAEAGVGLSTPALLPGLPVSGTTSEAAAGGAITGLPGGAGGQPAGTSGPISFGGGGSAGNGGTGGVFASDTPKEDTEGKLGPIGALSVVAFLLAFTAAALAGTTEKHTEWRRRRRRLSKRLGEARAAHEAAQQQASNVQTRTPNASVEYDTAARFLFNIVEANLQRAAAWESRVRELYPVYCRRAHVDPVPLAFPALPAPQDEVASLLVPQLPWGRQVGGYGINVVPPDGTEPPATVHPAPPVETPEPAAAGAARPGAGEPPGDGGDVDREPVDQPPARPSVDDVLDGVGDRIRRMREPGQAEPPGRRRFLRRGHRRNEERPS